MRFLAYETAGAIGLAVDDGTSIFLGKTGPAVFASLHSALSRGTTGLRNLAAGLAGGDVIDPEVVRVLPPLPTSRVICVGLNYRSHSAECGLDQPPYPSFFMRYPSSFVGTAVPSSDRCFRSSSTSKASSPS